MYELETTAYNCQAQITKHSDLASYLTDDEAKKIHRQIQQEIVDWLSA